MKDAAYPTVGVLVLLWVAGLVLAKGFWSTLIAVVCPIWSYYLLAERLMHMWGVI